VVRSKIIGSQWRPRVGCDVIRCETVGGNTVRAIDNARRFIERTGGRFTAKWHRRTRFPRSGRQIHAVDCVRGGAIIHTTEDVEVGRGLGEPITHDRCWIRSSGRPRTGCAVGRSGRAGRRWCWRSSTTTQSVDSHRIAGTSGICCNFAYYDHNRLPVGKVEGERSRRSRRIRATPLVGKIVSAEVGRIECLQVSSQEDVVSAYASGVRVHAHALGRTGGVGEGVGIIMMLLAITERPRAHLWSVTCARNTIAEESIRLCGITCVDASVHHDRRARRRCRWRWRRCWCAATPAWE
jgi:hypothetical protein